MSNIGEGSAVEGDKARPLDQAVGVAGGSALRETRILREAILNSADVAIIATDARGVIQLFNTGAERMLGYAAGEVVNKKTSDALFDPQQLIDRAKALSAEFATTVTPGFGALAFKVARGMDDRFDLDYIRKDCSRSLALVSIAALRDGKTEIIGYLIIAHDNSAAHAA